MGNWASSLGLFKMCKTNEMCETRICTCSYFRSGNYGNYDHDGGDSPRTPTGRSSEGGLTKLAYQDVRRSQALREALDQHYYGQLSFSPDINPKSRAIGKVRAVASGKARGSRAIGFLNTLFYLVLVAGCIR